MAASLLWILDASINISMEPFRAFVADMLPEEQRTRGFAMQSIFIGLGAVIASALPWLLTNVLHVRGAASSSGIPFNVKISFYLGAAAFLGAVLWTIFTTKEMPVTMRQLAWVQICTWLGLFCMWIYFPVAVAHNVYGAEDQSSPLYAQGVEWAGICFGIYSAVCFVFSFALPWLARVAGRKTTHSVCLACGALGLISVAVIHDKDVLILSMLGVGMAWASTLSMPYVILSSAIPPERTGIYMGIFNFFIVTPEILASLCFGWLMNHVLHNNRVAAVVAGGVFMLLAALLVQRVKEPRPALVKPIQAAA